MQQCFRRLWPSQKGISVSHQFSSILINSHQFSSILIVYVSVFIRFCIEQGADVTELTEEMQ